MLLQTIRDYFEYLRDELSNRDKDKGWEPNEMTELFTEIEEGRSDDTIAKARRDFWKRMMNER